MPKADNKAVATALYNQHREGTNFAPLTGELAIDDWTHAYAVQDELMSIYLEKNPTWRLGGYKVALTSKAMQEMVGAEEPGGGLILAHQIHESGVELKANDYQRLCVESEIAMRMGADLPASSKPYDEESVASAIESCMAGTELIEDRNASYDFDNPTAAFLTITADLSWNRGCVLGPVVKDWQDLDLASIQGEMLINGEVVGTGSGADVLGHPLTALAWVSNHLISRGRSLKTGDVVMTGSVVRTHWLNPGDEMTTRFNGLGEVSLKVRG